MPKFLVTLQRLYPHHTTITVEAEDIHAARKEALTETANMIWEESDIEPYVTVVSVDAIQ
jgi:hypothetical protein